MSTRRSAPARVAVALVGLVALVALGSACRGRGIRSPEALQAAYRQALERDDPKAAYALLSPELQARISREQFITRWKAEAADHKAALADLEAMGAETSAPVRGGVTAHANGATLEWAEVSGHYLVVAGLPGLADTSTPAQAIRAWIAAVRAADFAALEALLSEDLRARLAEDWEGRIEAIEARLAEPGALELSADDRQALLRYDGAHAVTLEQSDRGWKITSLQ